MALANKIIYGDCMDVEDNNLTQSDLLRAEMKCLAWVIEKLPTQMIENPDYKPEEDIEELDEQQQLDLINDMFKQEVQFYNLYYIHMAMKTNNAKRVVNKSQRQPMPQMQPYYDRKTKTTKYSTNVWVGELPKKAKRS